MLHVNNLVSILNIGIKINTAGKNIEEVINVIKTIITKNEIKPID